jgi:DegV family protein with EDD domain
MKPIAVVTDSTSDLPESLAASLDIHIIACNVHFGTEVFRERVDLSNEQFYEKLKRAAELPKTSQPSVGAFLELYQSLAERYSGIVSVHLAAKLSGTLQSAQLAAAEMKDFPIVPIDSTNASMALGWVAVAAARAAQAGNVIGDVAGVASSTVGRVRLLALLENLDNVVKGGRLGKGAALLGTMLSIKPLLELKKGELNPLEKVRTWEKALTRLVELTRAYGPLDELAVLHAASPQVALDLAERMAAFFPRERILITEAGAVLGTHAGQGAVGVAVVLRDAQNSVK